MFFQFYEKVRDRESRIARFEIFSIFDYRISNLCAGGASGGPTSFVMARHFGSVASVPMKNKE